MVAASLYQASEYLNLFFLDNLMANSFHRNKKIDYFKTEMSFDHNVKENKNIKNRF